MAKFDFDLILKIAELVKCGQTDVARIALRHYSIITYFTDKNTGEVLLCFLHVFDLSSSNCAYKFYRLES